MEPPENVKSILRESEGVVVVLVAQGDGGIVADEDEPVVEISIWRRPPIPLNSFSSLLSSA